jgi:hypothetical protein
VQDVDEIHHAAGNLPRGWLVAQTLRLIDEMFRYQLAHQQ